MRSALAVLTAALVHVVSSAALAFLAAPHGTLFGTYISVWATWLAAWAFIGGLFITTRDHGLLLGGALSSAVLGVAWLAFGPVLFDLAGTGHLLLSVLYPLGGIAVFMASIPLTSFPQANSARLITALASGALSAIGVLAAGIAVGPLSTVAVAACAVAFCYGLGVGASTEGA